MVTIFDNLWLQSHFATSSINCLILTVYTHSLVLIRLSELDTQLDELAHIVFQVLLNWLRAKLSFQDIPALFLLRGSSLRIRWYSMRVEGECEVERDTEHGSSRSILCLSAQNRRTLSARNSDRRVTDA